MLITDFVARYQKTFLDAIQTTKVFDKSGQEISFDNAVQQIVDMLLRLENEDKKLMLVGNGGSAGITSHMALDFWKNGGIKATAFNDSSLLTAVANDYSFEEVFSKPIEIFANSGDMLFAISSSGNSKNIANAAKAATEKHCEVITFSGFSLDNSLLKLGDFNFYVASNSYGMVETAHAYIIHCLLDAKLYCKSSVDIFEKNMKMI
jgi:D-sedoheptulose 7-phosphate isomerase